MESRNDYYLATRKLLSESFEADLEWLRHGRVPGQKPDPIKNPWMPFQLADFVAIMTECVAQSEGARFMDIGSGIGTKLAVANQIFGLCCVGVECDDEMVDYAAKHNRTTLRMDCMHESVPSLMAVQDILWMYRPFRDPLSQRKLEHLVYDVMKPGAIIAGGALEAPPYGFEIIIDDWEVGQRGAWKKPEGWEPVIYDLDEDDE